MGSELKNWLLLISLSLGMYKMGVIFVRDLDRYNSFWGTFHPGPEGLCSGGANKNHLFFVFTHMLNVSKLLYTTCITDKNHLRGLQHGLNLATP